MFDTSIWDALSLRSRQPDPCTVGPYTLVRMIGEGGMGVVHEARHTTLQRRAAIKMLRPSRREADARARFEREARLTAQLSHPNVVQVHDFGRTHDGTSYYAMEYLDGPDLQRLVAADGPLDPARVVHLLMQAAEALVEVHAAGVVHRDIKPANLVLCRQAGRSDVLKVVDFGLVATIGGDRSDVDVVSGTPFFMAPETVTAPTSIDGRADVYAIGAVAYFLLTGQPPFVGSSIVEVLARHLHEPVTPPSALAYVPRDLEHVILRCLAKSPEDRWSSSTALLDALRSCRERAARPSTNARGRLAVELRA